VIVHALGTNGAGLDTAEAVAQARWATLEAFIAVEEAGADALLGEPGNALIPESGDVMVYGDGGAGKTTLTIDLAFHLAAGDKWLGIPIGRPVRVGLIENEGPRPMFRAKLRRKAEGWNGSPVGGRILVLEEPWSSTRLDDPRARHLLAQEITAHAIEVVMLGPVTRAGMNEAGTLQEVRDFMGLISDVRTQAGASVAFILVHHENKGGKVSGAWEGAGDTLLHVQAQGHGHTRVFIQKARWASSHHATTLHLAWAEGDGFEVLEETERDDATIADEILAAVLAAGGTSWSAIEERVSGKGERLRKIRDRLLESRRLINAGSDKRMLLWHADDPAVPATLETSRPDGDAVGTRSESDTGEAAKGHVASPVPPIEGTGTGRDAIPPTDSELEWR